MKRLKDAMEVETEVEAAQMLRGNNQELNEKGNKDVAHIGEILSARSMLLLRFPGISTVGWTF